MWTIMTKVLKRLGLGTRSLDNVLRGAGAAVELWPNRVVVIGTPLDDRKALRADWSSVGVDILAGTREAGRSVRR